jgi:hypothetical protein
LVYPIQLEAENVQLKRQLKASGGGGRGGDNGGGDGAETIRLRGEVEAAAAEKAAAAAEVVAVRAELQAIKDKNLVLLETQKRAAERESQMEAEGEEREKELTAVYDQVRQSSSNMERHLPCSRVREAG